MGVLILRAGGLDVPAFPRSSQMSPTVLRYKPFRCFFFSREEARMLVHVSGPGGETKFWLEPQVALAQAEGLDKKSVNELQKQVVEHAEDLEKAWKKHLG